MRPSIACVAGLVALAACQAQNSAVVEESPVQSAPVQRGPSLVYVPAYTHVTPGHGRQIRLATTLTIHNVSADGLVTVQSVEYHDWAGSRVRSYLAAPRVLGALESVEFIVSETDEATGGAGANFIVSFEVGAGAVPPLVEAVMVGNTGAGWLSFTSRGVPVR